MGNTSYSFWFYTVIYFFKFNVTIQCIPVIRVVGAYTQLGQGVFPWLPGPGAEAPGWGEAYHIRQSI
jgi:hypothetical protein